MFHRVSTSREGGYAKQGPNWPLLSLIRFFLATLVLASHVAIITDSPLEQLRRFSPWAAVIAFFSISGFSIAHSIHRRRQGYLKRRIWRIYPTFLFAMVLSSVPFLLKGARIELPHLAIQAPEPLVFLLNYIPVQAVFVKAIGTNAPLWSLGVEEFFYLCAPLLVSASRSAIWILIVASVVIACLGHRIGLNDYATSASILAPFALAWAWLLGWALWSSRDDPITQLLAVAIPCICVGLYNPFGGSLGAVTVSVTALLVIHQDHFAIFTARSSCAAIWLGDLSFPLYICHFPVFVFAYICGVKTWWAFTLLAILTAIFVLHAVDRPLRKR